MREYFEFKDQKHGIGTQVKYRNSFGTEKIGIVIKFEADFAFGDQIILANSISDYNKNTYDSINIKEFEKFAIVEILGKYTFSNTTPEDIKTTITENQVKTNDYVPKPQKPVFSKKMLRYLVIVPTILLVYCFFALIAGGGGTINWGPFFLFILVFDGIPLLIYLISYSNTWSEYKLAQNNYPKYIELVTARAQKELAEAKEKESQLIAEQKIINSEYEQAVASQHTSTPWAIKYITSPCPYCGHYKVRYAKWEDKSLSIAFWGIASSKIGTQYKCEHCKRMW